MPRTMDRQPIKLPLRVLSSPQAWKVESWLVEKDAKVHRGQRIVTLRNEETSAVEYALAPRYGRVTEQFVDAGSFVEAQKALGFVEECGHAVVFGGVCAICGKDVSTIHFGEVGRSMEAERLKVAYADEGLRITRGEAEVMETRNAKRLFAERRLSLVLDLDHTLVHATDDPRAMSVYDMKKEVLHGEEKKGKETVCDKRDSLCSAYETEKEEDDETMGEKDSVRASEVKGSIGLASDEGKEGNGRPNGEAGTKTLLNCNRQLRKVDEMIPVLEDVHMFKLPNCKDPMFVKLRPGLLEFLKKCAKLYELHIYTMGTSMYAAKVASLIDPDNSLFAGRITSRDHFREGRFNQKNIARLFPCDDSMVVIVDDREDVWLEPRKFYGPSYMPNLVKARAYAFWNGLREVYDRTSVNAIATSKLSSTKGVGSDAPCSDTDPRTQRSGEKSGPAGSPTEQSTHPSAADVQANAREEPEQTLDSGKDAAVDPEQGPLVVLCNAQEDDRLYASSPVHLERLAEVLIQCHTRFFDHAGKRKEASQFATSPGAPWKPPADVKVILEEMRKEVLRGCVISFSRICPFVVQASMLPIWRLAERYGAVCSELYNWRVTHVVAHRQFASDSEKSRLARVSEGKYVVSPEWLRDSCEGWRREDETKYIVESTGVDAFRGPRSIYAGYDEIDYEHLEKTPGDCGELGYGNRIPTFANTNRGSEVENGHDARGNELETPSSGESHESKEEDSHSFVAALELEMLEEMHTAADSDATENERPRMWGTGYELAGKKRRRGTDE